MRFLDDQEKGGGGKGREYVKRFGQAKSRGSSALLTLFVNLQDC